MTFRPNPLTTGPSRAPARAMLKAVGFTDADLRKPLIGVANTWIEIGPCNYHLRELAVHVKDGIRKAGGTPMEFNTVSISDGITMNTEGMMALARLNMPGLVLYGGSIAAGQFRGSAVTIQEVFEAVGAHGAGRMTDA